MKKSIHIAEMVLLGALIIQLSGCTTSKSLMKDGYSYSEAGMHQEAVDSFKASLTRKSSNVDARTGLKTSAQRVLDRLLDDYNQADMSANDADAVYRYLDSENFLNEIKAYNIELFIPNHYKRSFEKNRTSFLGRLYDEGMTFLDGEDFDQAQARFDEILNIDPEYRDVKSLKGTSVMEPKYRAANELMEQRRYREAYALYDAVTRRDASYKDAYERREEALQAGRFVLAVLPFENSSLEPNVEKRIHAYAVNNLVGSSNPFLKVVDRQNLDEIIAEQDFSLSGLANDASAVEVGNLTGAHAILLGQVIDFRVDPGQLRMTHIEAYESYSESVLQDDGSKKDITKYRPVRYMDYTNKNRVFVSFMIKLLDLETSEILVSEVVEREIGDDIHWASYKGSLKNLVPKVNYKPSTSRAAINDLRSLFDQRSDLISIDQLVNSAYQEVGAMIATRVDAYLE